MSNSAGTLFGKSLKAHEKTINNIRFSWFLALVN
jgi:hypothetical protein